MWPSFVEHYAERNKAEPVRAGLAAKELVMDELERRDYARLSDPGAAYAVVHRSPGVLFVNLHWLAEVIQLHEATGETLAEMRSEQERLDHVRSIVDQVDDDRLAWFLRQHRPDAGQ